MTDLFFLVSGENPTLPFSEIKSILGAEGFSYEVLGGLAQVLRVKADTQGLSAVASRSAMAKACGIEIASCEAEWREILKAIKNAEFASFLSSGETFVVRVIRVRGSSSRLEAWTLEKRIGEVIFESLKGPKVELRNPQKTFLGILTDGSFVFGVMAGETTSQGLKERTTRRKVFFHAAAMPAKLARCMVNLAQAGRGDTVLDPFCGTGTFLVEAGFMGCRVLGFDVKRYMVKGTLRNISLHGVEPEGLAVADARSIPLADESVDCIVTDPPYGTSATTLRMGARHIYESFLERIVDALKRERRICLAAPKSLEVSGIGERSGFKHLESHYIYVHRRLTREIAVFQRV